MPILIRTLNASLSAEISGLDITAELSSETIAALHAAWSHHLVLVFRDQPLTPEQLREQRQRLEQLVDQQRREQSGLSQPSPR